MRFKSQITIYVSEFLKKKTAISKKIQWLVDEFRAHYVDLIFSEYNSIRRGDYLHMKAHRFQNYAFNIFQSISQVVENILYSHSTCIIVLNRKSANVNDHEQMLGR